MSDLAEVVVLLRGDSTLSLIAAMFNRYVDGLAAFAPTDPTYYAATAERLTQGGYAPPR